MHPDNLTISVIIPAYNAEPFLAEALDSVFAQTVKNPLEVIVYNDGSTDGTAKIIETYGHPLIHLGAAESKGASHGRNEGLRAAGGELIAFLDADDLWLSKKLECQMEALFSREEASLVFGLAQEFDERGPRGDYRECCLPSLCFGRSEVFHQIGPFDTTLKLGDFAEWLSRAQEVGVQFVTPKSPVARRRHHGDNMGRRLQDQRKDYLEVVRRRLARRRESGENE